MMSKDIDHIKPILFAATAGMSVPKYVFVLSIMEGRIELELSIFRLIKDRPASKSARDRDYVLLRIPSIDTERMQFQQLARIVFVEARPAISSRHDHILGRRL